MPTYEYRCDNGHTFDIVQKMSDAALTTCPECGAHAERVISGGQGVIFKGTGFYITDYGKDGKGPRKDSDGSAAPSAAPAGDSPAKSDAKADAKTESKPAPAPAPKSDTP